MTTTMEMEHPEEMNEAEEMQVRGVAVREHGFSVGEPSLRG